MWFFTVRVGGMGVLDELQAGDPRRIGHYSLEGRLGAGGMGRVYLGRSPGGRHVAIKAIRAELAENPDFRARFAREVSAARKVSGLFTAPVVDADLDGPVPWLATSYVTGPSLAAAVATGGPLPAGPVLALAAGLAEGLDAIHSAGIVHRDLKPSNVILAEDGPRILDFGISRSAELTGLTQSGMVVGSPGFMSPEQAEGQEVGPPSDIFSLGATLAFAASGEGPFGEGTSAALLYRVVHSDPDTGKLPPEVRPLIQRCLAKDPQHRPAAAQLLTELATTAPAPRSPARPASPGSPGHDRPVPAPDPAKRLLTHPATERVADQDLRPGGTPSWEATVTTTDPHAAPDSTGDRVPDGAGGRAGQPRGFRWLVIAGSVAVLIIAGTVTALLLARQSHSRPLAGAAHTVPAGIPETRAATHGNAASPSQLGSPATPTQRDSPAPPAQSASPATPTQHGSPAPPAQDGNPAPPAQLTIDGLPIGISAVNTNPDVTAVATTLATYFGAVNSRNYLQAWDTYSPALQAAVPYQPWASQLSALQPQNSQIAVQSIQHDPGQNLDVIVSFHSHQDNPSEPCSNWSLDYQLAPSQPSPASGSLAYLINKVTSVGPGHLAC
jgi:serine/threonine protein kinase